MLVQDAHLELVVDVPDPIDALGIVLCFQLLAEAADRAAQRHQTVVDRDGNRCTVDLRVPKSSSVT
ncbi:MAG TPA: hypothetical protein VF101_20320 [Gaiellaceae bacterium]